MTIRRAISAIIMLAIGDLDAALLSAHIEPACPHNAQRARVPWRVRGAKKRGEEPQKPDFWQGVRAISAERDANSPYQRDPATPTNFYPHPRSPALAVAVRRSDHIKKTVDMLSLSGADQKNLAASAVVRRDHARNGGMIPRFHRAVCD